MRYKKQIILFMTISVLFSFSLLVVKASSEIWIQTYGGKGYTEGHFPIFFARTSLVETPEGGYAIASSTNSYGAGEFDFLLIKTDFNGNMLWNKTYGGPEHERASSLVVTSDGGFAIAGSTYTFDEASPDFWLVKTDANGNMEWNKTIGGNREDYAYSMVQTSDGGYALAGITHSFGYYAGWLVKTDSNGNEEWNQTYGGEGDDWISSIVECSDGGFAAVGTIVTSDMASPFFWLVKTDALGNEEWNQTYGREEYQQATAGSDDYAKASSLVTTSDGGFALAGSISDFENGEDFWLVKTDALGNMEWNQRYGGEDSDTAYSVIETPDRGFALCGKKGFANRAPSDFLLVKTDANGNIEWNQTYGGTEHESAHSLVATSDGGFALVGEIKYNQYITQWHDIRFHGPTFFWLVKTDEFGNISELPSLDDYEELFNQLSPETSNKMNNAQTFDYESSDAQSLIQQAKTEFNGAYSLAREGQWQDAVTHLQNVSTLIDQAIAEEQSYLEQQEIERSPQTQSTLLTVVAVVSAVAIVLGLIVYVMKRNRRKIEKE